MGLFQMREIEKRLDAGEPESELAALRARVAELEADAARYQFIKANVRRLDINGLCLSIQNLEARIDQMRPGPSAPDARPCTCHPDDNPPVPCPRMYALHECRRAAARQEGGA